MTTIHTLNQQQYADKSNAYLTSTVHAQGEEFAKMRAIIQDNKLTNLLDLGCGGGHVTYQLADKVYNVVAYDLVEQMVATVTEQATEKGLTNVTGVVGKAERLPFADGEFDCVISRYSAHHWQNVGQAIGEVYRVLASGGKCVIVDILGSSQPTLDNLFQTLETIRDPSHVRNYSLSEWLNFAEYAGFTVETVEKQSLFLDFDSWVERMNTPDFAVTTLQYLLAKAPQDFRQYYQVTDNGSFTSPVGVLVLTKS